MNHFAHAWVASQVRPEPRFVLGAILPDLTSFLRLQLPAQPVPEIAEGIALHHATDAIFHALPGFREANRAGIGALSRLGLRRGPARAASHVGLELMLDSILAAHTRPTLAIYQAALGEHGCLRWPLESSHDAVTRMAERLTGHDPSATRTPASLAERIQRTLAPRPTLALRHEELAPLESWLEQIEPTWTHQGAELANHTLTALTPTTAEPPNTPPIPPKRQGR